MATITIEVPDELIKEYQDELETEMETQYGRSAKVKDICAMLAQNFLMDFDEMSSLVERHMGNDVLEDDELFEFGERTEE